MAVEDVSKAAADIVQVFLCTIDGNFAALLEVEWPHIVETHDVVGVRMSEQYGVHARNLGSERLLAKVRCGVNQDAVVSIVNVDGRAQPIVARVIRTAHRAMTADRGYPDASAGTEHRDFQRVRRHLCASLSFGARARGLLLMLLHGLHETKPQLGQCIFDQPLFFDAEIAAALLLPHRKHIYGWARLRDL